MISLLLLSHLNIFMQVKIGQTLVSLDGERTSCRLGECILGNLVTDAAVYNVALTSNTTNSWTIASVALWTSNSIMSSIITNKTGNDTQSSKVLSGMSSSLLPISYFSYLLSSLKNEHKQGQFVLCLFTFYIFYLFHPFSTQLLQNLQLFPISRACTP